MPRFAPTTASADGAFSSKPERPFLRNHDKFGPMPLPNGESALRQERPFPNIQIGSNEGALTGDIPTDDQGLDLGRSFVCDETFHIAHVAYDVKIERDAVATEDVARHPAHFAPLDTAVILGQRGPRFLQFTVVNQASKPDAIELHRGDVAKHADKHRLDHLGLGDELTELDSSLCVG